VTATATNITLPSWPPIVVTDASVWVARLIPQEPKHTACLAWWQAFDLSSGRIIAPVLLLSEVCGAISRRTGQPTLARRVLRSLKGMPELAFVTMDRELAEHAAQLAADLGLRGADAVYVALAHRLHAPLLSLDGEHAAKAGQMVEVIQL
jgi:predicted nucleic acid-binding protein